MLEVKLIIENDDLDSLRKLLEEAEQYGEMVFPREIAVEEIEE